MKPPGDRRFYSMFPFTRVLFWVPILTHSHIEVTELPRKL